MNAGNDPLCHEINLEGNGQHEIFFSNEIG